MLIQTPLCLNCGRAMKQTAPAAFDCRACRLTELGSRSHQKPQEQQQQQQQQPQPKEED
jgi:tRNA(Ile2) C34 agmatinyltransferase TiaS